MGAGQSQTSAQPPDGANAPPVAGYEELARRYEEALRIVSNDQMVLGDPLTSIGTAEGQMLEQLKRYVNRGERAPDSDTVLYQAVSAFVRDTAGFRAGLEEALAQAQSLSQPMKDLVARLLERQTDLVVGKLFYQYKYLHLSSVTLDTVKTSVRFIGELVTGLEREAGDLEAEADGKLQALVRSAAEGRSPESGAPGIIRNAEAVRADLKRSLKDLAGKVRSLGEDAIKAVGSAPGDLMGKQMEAESKSIKAMSQSMQLPEEKGGVAVVGEDESDPPDDQDTAGDNRGGQQGNGASEKKPPGGDVVVSSFDRGGTQNDPMGDMYLDDSTPGRKDRQNPGFVRFDGRQQQQQNQNQNQNPQQQNQNQNQNPQQQNQNPQQQNQNQNQKQQQQQDQNQQQKQQNQNPQQQNQNPQQQNQNQQQQDQDGQGPSAPSPVAVASVPTPALATGQSGGDSLLGVANNLFMRDVTYRVSGDFAPDSLYL